MWIGSPDDPGLAAVRFLYEQMHVGRAWSIRENRGFTWWGGRVAQRVRAEEPTERDRVLFSRVRVETDFLRSVPEDDGNLARIGALLQGATLSGLRMNDAGSASMACAASFHRETPAHLSWLFLVAAALQVAGVEAMLDETAGGVQGIPGVSGHPAKGPRVKRAGMLAIARTAIQPEGKRPSRWKDDRELARVCDSLPRLGARVAEIDALGLGAEVPFRLRTKSSKGPTLRLRVATKEEHPRLGSGLHLRLRLPLSLGFVEQTRLALHLNGLEHESGDCPHFLGSWCPSEGPGPLFTTFAPNAVHAAGLLRELVAGMMDRARWIGELDEEGGLRGFVPEA